MMRSAGIPPATSFWIKPSAGHPRGRHFLFICLQSFKEHMSTWRRMSTGKTLLGDQKQGCQLRKSRCMGNIGQAGYRHELMPSPPKGCGCFVDRPHASAIKGSSPCLREDAWNAAYENTHSQDNIIACACIPQVHAGCLGSEEKVSAMMHGEHVLDIWQIGPA